MAFHVHTNRVSSLGVKSAAGMELEDVICCSSTKGSPSPQGGWRGRTTVGMHAGLGLYSREITALAFIQSQSVSSSHGYW